MSSSSCSFSHQLCPCQRLWRHLHHWLGMILLHSVHALNPVSMQVQLACTSNNLPVWLAEKQSSCSNTTCNNRQARSTQSVCVAHLQNFDTADNARLYRCNAFQTLVGPIYIARLVLICLFASHRCQQKTSSIMQ